MSLRPRIAFFGSSLVSAYWNGAATYYRGIVRALSERGFDITFYEPDAYDRQQHRDIADPKWARVVVYSTDGEQEVRRALREASTADIIVKTSGVGAFDDLLDRAVLEHKATHALSIYWDVDAPATLDRLQTTPGDPLRARIPAFDLVLTYGGGDAVCAAYAALGARQCAPIYNAVDPLTHHPTPPQPRFLGDLSLLANRLPDREARIDRAGCFAYSPVEGASANDLPGALPDEVREERRARFMAVAEEVSAAKLRERVGATMQVLVDSAPALGRKGGVGRSYADAPEIDGNVRLLPPEKASKVLRVGEFTRARIVGTQGHDLVGLPV